MHPTIRAILFDADGVIVHPYRFRAWLEREHAITPAIMARTRTRRVLAHGIAIVYGKCANYSPDLSGTRGVSPPQVLS